MTIDQVALSTLIDDTWTLKKELDGVIAEVRQTESV